MTYSLRIDFYNGRVYTREGLDWEAAMGLKEYFMNITAVKSGSMTPERERGTEEKGN